MQLSEKYRIIEDDNNVILQFFEIRSKKNKDGLVENFEYVDNFYYPTLKSALISYTQKELKYSKSIDEVLERINSIESLINNYNKTNKQK